MCDEKEFIRPTTHIQAAGNQHDGGCEGGDNAPDPPWQIVVRLVAACTHVAISLLLLTGSFAIKLALSLGRDLEVCGWSKLTCMDIQH